MAAESLITFRIRYQETDRMATVYHANYLIYFEMGRTEFMREHGICYRDMEEKGYAMVVIDVRARFRASARYDDLVTLRTTLPAHNKLLAKFDYTLHRGADPSGELICDGSTILAFLGQGGKPSRMPAVYLEIIGRCSGGGDLVRDGRARLARG